MSEEVPVERRELYRGKVVHLQLTTVLLPDGRRRTREILVHPGAAAVVPLMDDRIMLIEQYRAAVGRKTLEIPAGTLEPGESPEDCAQRELLEETGFQAESWSHVTAYYPSVGYTTEVIHLFRASGLRNVRELAPEFPVRFLTVNEVRERIRTGAIMDSKTIIGVLLAT
ncbi:MAG TPA: NUDIX hydrolase [Methanomicrobia archaeon]|nr:NUDIX hydrolase [Methanomicrobia archaeon]